jgi:hypothetical protein
VLLLLLSNCFAALQSKLAVFVELFGREASAPLLRRFPVILTMGTTRIREVRGKG